MKRIVYLLMAGLILAGTIITSVVATHHTHATASRPSTGKSIFVSTSARGMCTIDGNGNVLYEKNSHAKLACASTTKILTAITVLDNCDDLDTPFEVHPKSLGIEGTSIYLQKGEKLTVRELLYGMMLRSGNDASMALALRVSDSKQAFAERMNETARKAGAMNSSFKNPHGLDEPDHYTTAYDLALITAYAMKNETFAQIVATKSIKISGTEYPRVINNKNRLLNGLKDCVGVKTGFTKKAGRCYVGAVKKNDQVVICVVLNCGPMFEESAELMESGMFEINKEIAKEAWYNNSQTSICTEESL